MSIVKNGSGVLIGFVGFGLFLLKEEAAFGLFLLVWRVFVETGERNSVRFWLGEGAGSSLLLLGGGAAFSLFLLEGDGVRFLFGRGDSV